MERIQSVMPTALVVTVGLVVGLVLGLPDRSPAPSPWSLPVATVIDETPSTMTIHVSGEVQKPGLVVVAEGARVADAVLAAGGATRHADLTAVNLAAPVSDGDHLAIPQVGSVETSVSPGPSGDGKVAVNRASVEELQRLPGVGPVLASRIVAHREEFGRFETIEDLLDVSGIGERILANLRELVTVP